MFYVHFTLLIIIMLYGQILIGNGKGDGLPHPFRQVYFDALFGLN